VLESAEGGPVEFDGSSVDVVDEDAHTITIPDHGMVDGQAVVYRADGSEVVGLTDGRSYRVSVVDGETLELTDPVAASRDDEGRLILVPSFESADTDGDDYVEGGGGNDVVFGNLGQDDIIGGSSDLFSLETRAARPDGSDRLFGGAGTDAARNDPGDLGPQGHARDADVILGDNGNIFRLVRFVGQELVFHSFRYDTYTDALPSDDQLRLVPRAAELLGSDYTPGGPDFRPDKFDEADPGYLPDIGAADELHGESGDDWLYGMVGNDALFGDGQDDDLIGGWGHDWMSGGAGTDGLLGDDGRIFTSRNVAQNGDPDPFSEPLYGVGKLDQVNQRIDTPGAIQEAIINVAGQLKKTVDLTPFNLDPDTSAQNPHFDPAYADDILYGGLGDDFLHGGSGDDAMSGAEALPEAAALVFPAQGAPNPDRTDGIVLVTGFDVPVNPGNALGFEAYRANEFALYDEYDPRLKIQIDDAGQLVKPGQAPSGAVHEFFLNFEAFGDENDPAGTRIYDGNDVLFGDLGHDWSVGGTGQDRFYGGFGSDLLNADDNLETNGGANDVPDAPEFAGTNDTLPAELALGADIAYGGAGRDVLIANTGADRLIDWVGEFNSYLVPFGPFGAFTVSRAVPPRLFDYLYALSGADGADPTRGSDAARNGEPEGELGLVTQNDRFPFFGWQDQTGAPDDPQPGNIPGGARDVLRAADFNLGAAVAFAPDSGSFSVSDGRLEVAPEELSGDINDDGRVDEADAEKLLKSFGTSKREADLDGDGVVGDSDLVILQDQLGEIEADDAVSVFHVGEYLPAYFEVAATINAGKPTAGLKSNSYLIFDYQSPADFKFAGVNISTDKLELGHRDAEGWHVDVQTPARLRPDTDYEVLLAVNGLTAILVIDNEQVFSHAFAPRVDPDGFTYGLNAGMVGIGAYNSVSRIDNVAVQVLRPEITFEDTEDFSDGIADLLTGLSTGTWAVSGGRLDGRPARTSRSGATTSPWGRTRRCSSRRGYPAARSGVSSSTTTGSTTTSSPP
jgi:Ca2+-binding RTX toxin-like protein